jgi:hypothetical protein
MNPASTIDKVFHHNWIYERIIYPCPTACARGYSKILKEWLKKASGGKEKREIKKRKKRKTGR